MAAMKKIAGVIAGIASVAVIGVAVAQSVPPNPFVKDAAMGAGQQNAHLAPMGETGTPWPSARVETAQIQQAAPVAVVEEQRQEVAQAPAQQEMGAAPAPVQEAAPAPVKPARRDRG